MTQPSSPPVQMIGAERLEAIACYVRGRGTSSQRAAAEWKQLSAEDRRWWCDDVRRALTRAGVKCA